LGVRKYFVSYRIATVTRAERWSGIIVVCLTAAVRLCSYIETSLRGMYSSRQKTASNSLTSACRDGSTNGTTTPVFTYLHAYFIVISIVVICEFTLRLPVTKWT